MAERLPVKQVDVGSSPTQFANRDPMASEPWIPQQVTLAQWLSIALWTRSGRFDPDMSHQTGAIAETV